MGLLVDGIWQDQWYDTKSTDGRFVRPPARYRNWVTADGAPGPSGDGGFPAAAGRYHLYVTSTSPALRYRHAHQHLGDARPRRRTVSSGSASRGKKPCAMISRSGTGGAG